MPRLAVNKSRNAVEPPREEGSEFQSLAGLLRSVVPSGDSGPKVSLIVDGRETVLPAVATELLSVIVEALAAGEELTITRTRRELTTTEAATLLNVSRQYLVRLCDEGRLSYRWEGAHRRLALDDVLTYRSRRDKERDVKFADLVRKSAEAGEYDLPIEWPPQG